MKTNKKLIPRNDNARKWKHAQGGFIKKHQDGTTQGGILKRFGKAVYGLFLPEYEGTFQEAYRQARINGDDKFKWDGNHYTTDLKPDETLEAAVKLSNRYIRYRRNIQINRICSQS